jgi:hypothetical protein
MTPTNDHEKEIAEKVDRKARAIREGRGIWDDSVLTEMKIAVGFELDLAEEQFLEAYASWRRRNPLID